MRCCQSLKSNIFSCWLWAISWYLLIVDSSDEVPPRSTNVGEVVGLGTTQYHCCNMHEAISPTFSSGDLMFLLKGRLVGVKRRVCTIVGSFAHRSRQILTAGNNSHSLNSQVRPQTTSATPGSALIAVKVRSLTPRALYISSGRFRNL